MSAAPKPTACHDPDAPTKRLPVRVTLPDAPLGLWESLRVARKNILGIIPEPATREPIISGQTTRRWHMVMDPDALRRILLDKLDSYPKSDVTKNMLRPAIGESLFIAEGAHWRWQRRTAAPAFSRRNLQTLTPFMTQAAVRAVERVRAAGPRAVNMYDEMVTTTFDVISDVTFGEDDGVAREAVHRGIEAYLENAGKISFFDVLGLPDWVPRPSRMIARSEMVAMKQAADGALAARATRGPAQPPDLLDLLAAGADPDTGREMSRDELRDNLMTFVVAGHETTALALSWALYLCAFDTGVQDRARAEAQEVLRGRPAGAQDVERLVRVRRIIDETLRLYPPGAFVSRTARAEDVLCGKRIRPGDTVMIPIYALHRHAALWERPDAFDPDRWAGPKPARYSYLPFGDGPRICIGAGFAVQEAVIILATLLANFRFTAVPGRDPDPVMIVTLRPEGGVWLEAEPMAAEPG